MNPNHVKASYEGIIFLSIFNDNEVYIFILFYSRGGWWRGLNIFQYSDTGKKINLYI